MQAVSNEKIGWIQGKKAQAIKELSSFFNTVRQAIFHFKPNGFDSRKATDRKQKPQIDFLRFLCYDKNNHFKEEKGDAYERRD